MTILGGVQRRTATTFMKKVSIALALIACLFASIGLAQTAAPIGPMITYEINAPNVSTGVTKEAKIDTTYTME